MSNTQIEVAADVSVDSVFSNVTENVTGNFIRVIIEGVNASNRDEMRSKVVRTLHTIADAVAADRVVLHDE